MMDRKKLKEMHKAYFRGNPKRCFEMCDDMNDWREFSKSIPHHLNDKAYQIMQQMDEDAQDAFEGILRAKIRPDLVVKQR